MIQCNRTTPCLGWIFVSLTYPSTRPAPPRIHEEKRLSIVLTSARQTPLSTNLIARAIVNHYVSTPLKLIIYISIYGKFATDRVLVEQ